MMRALLKCKPPPGTGTDYHQKSYQVNKAQLLERIGELVREKTIEGISDIRDESDRKGMRVVIEIKRDGSAMC